MVTAFETMGEEDDVRTVGRQHGGTGRRAGVQLLWCSSLRDSAGERLADGPNQTRGAPSFALTEGLVRGGRTTRRPVVKCERPHHAPVHERQAGN